jgi:hypothetical protein
MATECDFHFISFVNSVSDELQLPLVRPGLTMFFRDSWLAPPIGKDMSAAKDGTPHLMVKRAVNAGLGRAVPECPLSCVRTPDRSWWLRQA